MQRSTDMASLHVLFNYFKQLLDELFVISEIINVEVSVIDLSFRLRLITLTEIISDITKTESHNCFIMHCFKENNDKCISHQTQFIFDEPCSYVNLTLLLEIMHCVCNLWIIY